MQKNMFQASDHRFHSIYWSLTVWKPAGGTSFHSSRRNGESPTPIGRMSTIRRAPFTLRSDRRVRGEHAERWGLQSWWKSHTLWRKHVEHPAMRFTFSSQEKPCITFWRYSLIHEHRSLIITEVSVCSVSSLLDIGLVSGTLVNPSITNEQPQLISLTLHWMPAFRIICNTTVYHNIHTHYRPEVWVHRE